MIRLASLLTCAFALIGCDRSLFLVVRVEADVSVPPVSQLHVVAALDSQHTEFDLPAEPSSTPLVFPRTFSVELAPDKRGMLSLSVAALDAARTPVAASDVVTTPIPVGDAPTPVLSLSRQPTGCGAMTQACCAENYCAQGACVGGRCGPCGLVSQPCCPSGTACISGVCTMGLCAACGDMDQPCCAGNTCNSGFFACRMGACRSVF